MTIPTVSQLRDQIIGDIEGAVGITVPWLSKAVFRVLGTALAGVQYLAYRFLAWILDQVFTSTADEAQLLLRGEQYGMSPTGAVSSVLTATATGDVGTPFAAGTIWTCGGQVYAQLTAVVSGVSGAAISVQALLPGSVGNQVIGATLQLGSSIIGADGTATVTGTTTEGEDAEDVEVFRGKVEDRERNKPQGGSFADFILWTLEVPGIVKAFAYRPTPGFVVVNPLVSLGVDRIPSASKILEVSSYVGDDHTRPFGSNLLVQAMTELVVNATITWTGTDQIKAQVVIDIAAYLLTRFPRQYPDEAAPVDGIGIADIYAICVADGARPSAITMTVNGSPGTSYTLQPGELVKLGAITWA